MSDHTIVIIFYVKIFFVESVYSCHLFLISSTSDMNIQFVSFIESSFAWNVPLVPLSFLKRSLVFPFHCFPLFLCIDCWGLFSYLSLLFFETLHLDAYIFPFLLCFFISLLPTAICRASPDNHFAFLHFFSMGMVLIPVSRIMLRTSVHRSSGTLSDLGS